MYQGIPFLGMKCFSEWRGHDRGIKGIPFFWLIFFSEWRGHEEADACYDSGIKVYLFVAEMFF